MGAEEGGGRGGCMAAEEGWGTGGGIGAEEGGRGFILLRLAFKLSCNNTFVFIVPCVS